MLHGRIQFPTHIVSKLIFQSGLRHVVFLGVKPPHLLHFRHMVAKEQCVQLLNGALQLMLDFAHPVVLYQLL